MLVSWEEFEKIIIGNMREVYSETVVDHGMNPRNIGSLKDANAYHTITGPCGDTMSIWLRVEDGVVTGTGFMTDGCCTSIASGSMTTELAKGKTLQACLDISQADILKALEGLPEDTEHCALLAANTLHGAVNYFREPEEPEKPEAAG